jgi:hypothetical protein
MEMLIGRLLVRPLSVPECLPMLDPTVVILVIGIVAGFALGYGAHEFISRRRQQAARARRDLGLD